MGYNCLMQFITTSIRPLARSFYYSMLELLDRRRSRRNSLYAPPKLDFVTGGTADFEIEARAIVDYYINLTGLQPNHSVLDVGCGIGRIAAPLTEYLGKDGSYEGFDIVEIGIRWATNHITRQYPNFKFQRANVFSEMYHPDGKFKASEYRFPYKDKSFDRIIASSLFTHMLPADMNNYLREITRVMKDDGRALITYFLLNDHSRDAIKNRDSAINFMPYSSECWVRDISLPESALCYNEPFVERAHAEAGLSIEKPIHYGSWSCKDGGAFLQDVTISTKQF